MLKPREPANASPVKVITLWYKDTRGAISSAPELKTKIESLLSVVENAAGDLTQADEAEQAVIEEIRALGQAALAGWAELSHEATRDSFIQSHPKAHRSGKKKRLCVSRGGVGTEDKTNSASSGNKRR